MSIDDYLRQLRRRGLRDERALEEIRAHLEDAAVELGEEQAIRQFGDSRAVARSLRRFPRGAFGLALLAGAAIGYVDSRPGWDSTGMSAAFVFAAAGLLTFWRPHYGWCWALLLGGFIPLIEAIGDGDGGSVLALAIALLGSGIGWAVAHVSTESATSA